MLPDVELSVSCTVEQHITVRLSVRRAGAIVYGYAWVSRSDDDFRNLDTQLRPLSDHGILDELIFLDAARGHTLQRAGWRDLMSRVQAAANILEAAD